MSAPTQVRACRDCHTPFRHRNTPAVEAPGTAAHHARGLCRWCANQGTYLFPRTTVIACLNALLREHHHTTGAAA